MTAGMAHKKKIIGMALSSRLPIARNSRARFLKTYNARQGRGVPGASVPGCRRFVANGRPTRGIVCLDCSRPQDAARAAAAIVGAAQSVEHYEIALIGETFYAIRTRRPGSWAFSDGSITYSHFRRVLPVFSGRYHARGLSVRRRHRVCDQYA